MTQPAHAVELPPCDPVLPWVESPFFYTLLPQMCRNAEEQKRATLFHEQGYLLLEDFFSHDELDRIIEEVEPLFDPTVPDGRRSRIRVQDAWQESQAVRGLAVDERVEEILRFLYRRRPVPFQTLNFRYGTEQRGHSDAIHFYSFPPRFMCGVWVALEDVGPENGTLFYYPGSNRLPDFSFPDLGLGSMNQNLPGSFDVGQAYRRYEDFLERLMAARGLKRHELTVKRGSALVWSANLVHGGSPILRPGSTRWSQVTHYFFADCLYYTPMLSNWVTGDLYLRKVVDVKTGRTVPNTYRGAELRGVETPGTFKLLLDGAAGEEIVRGLTNQECTHLKRMVETIEGSWSYKIGRALGAPLRLAKQFMGRRAPTSGA